MKTIQNVKAEIDTQTVNFWRRAVVGGIPHDDFGYELKYRVICDLKADLAMLKAVERDGFIKGVNAVLDDSMIEVLESNMNLELIAIFTIKKYDKGVYDND
jgi:hypothetical protein